MEGPFSGPSLSPDRRLIGRAHSLPVTQATSGACGATPFHQAVLELSFRSLMEQTIARRGHNFLLIQVMPEGENQLTEAQKRGKKQLQTIRRTH